MRHCFIALLWLFSGLLATTIWGAGEASAHASIVSSSPIDGGHAAHPPAGVTIDLNEPVTLVDGSSALLDANGTRHALAGTRLDDGGRRVTLVPAQSLSDGAYLATARVVSPDTHVISLSVRFSVGSVTGVTGALAADSAGDDGVVDVLGRAARGVVYLGTVLSAGLLLASRWVWPELQGDSRFRHLYRAGVGIAIIGLGGRLLALTAERVGGIREVTPGDVAAVTGGPGGAAIVVAAVLGAAAMVRPPGSGRIGSSIGYLGAAALLVAITLGGHGGSTQRWPWAFLDTLVHAYAASVWFGGVAVLLWLRPTPTRIDRWHRVAIGHVLLVGTSGIILALYQIAPIQALITTGYGRVLLAKVGAVLGAATIGYVVYRRIRGGGRSSTRRLLVMESVLAVGVLSLTAVLSSTTPARDSYTTDVATRLDFGSGAAFDVGIDTIRRGDQTITVASAGGSDGSPATELDVELSSADANVARLPVDMVRSDSGGRMRWRSAGLIVPVAGDWKVTVRYDDGSGPRLASFRVRVR